MARLGEFTHELLTDEPGCASDEQLHDDRSLLGGERNPLHTAYDFVMARNDSLNVEF